MLTLGVSMAAYAQIDTVCVQDTPGAFGVYSVDTDAASLASSVNSVYSWQVLLTDTSTAILDAVITTEIAGPGSTNQIQID